VDVEVPGGERGNVQTAGGDRVSTISLLGCSTSVALAMGPTDEEEEKYHAHRNLCPLSRCVSFSCTHFSFLQLSINHPRKQCMIKLDVSSLKVSSSNIIRSEFLALLHIPRMINLC